MTVDRIAPDISSGPPPAGSYSPAIASGGFLFLAGQGPFDRQGNKCPGTFREEAELAFGNLRDVAEAAGADLADAVRVGVYLSSMSSFAELNTIMPRYFGDPLPARTTIPVSLNGFQIEVDAIVRLRT
jgi:2-iminobutanoate/2-iminopropanoate deaminase